MKKKARGKQVPMPVTRGSVTVRINRTRKKTRHTYCQVRYYTDLQAIHLQCLEARRPASAGKSRVVPIRRIGMLWSRILKVVGGIAMMLGTLDPLEGSLLVLPGSGERTNDGVGRHLRIWSGFAAFG